MNWRGRPHDVCPVCKSADVATATGPTAGGWRFHPGESVTFPAHCPGCGWCRHHGAEDGTTCPACGRPAAHPSARWVPEHFARPKGMPDEELAFRVKLYQRWADGPASEYLAELAYFADWLADRGDPEEAAARSAWSLYGAKRGDPAGWWRWRVELPAAAGGWVAPLRGVNRPEFAGPARASLKGQHHNSRWFLGWPPGVVRFTGVDDRSRWCVTVQRGRSLTYSRPYELTRPLGYVALFHPPGKGYVTAAESAADLLAELEEGLGGPIDSEDV